jgi:multiple sugar transport system permease protein
MRRRRYTKLLKVLGIICFLVFFMFPIYWLVLTSLKMPGDITASPVVWFTTNLSLDNYRLLFGYAGKLWGQEEYVGRSFLPAITPYLFNSITVGIVSSAIATLLGSFLAYGVLVFGFGEKRLYNWLLSLRMIPPVVVAIPMFMIFRSLRLIDNPWSLVIAYLMINMPFATLLLFGFMRDIPKEIGEAAVLDGCSSFAAFFRLMVPLTAPGMTAVFIISFLMCWNELLLANALTTTTNAQTFPVYTTNFSQVERGTAWGPAAAGGVIGIVPMLISSLYIQKYLVRGLTLGAVKG